ncbi:glycosyltransferase family 4 protein [Rummeliibacillus pycnus]|uniref:glycosyltransferase family 4 protein n=1 Tax=Rummeliibacillus pycnus TaxID=101070 RepID=UPI000C9CD6F7|nr:glycosyltransferase family 4 protein [Rummeliibacillus pycnus]
MKKVSVVFLRSNPIDPDSRVEKEVNTLIKSGYDVKILAWDRDSKYKINESYLNLKNGKAKIYRFGIPAKFGAGKKNLKAFLFFQYRILIWLYKHRDEYQIIHACDFDTAYTAYNCAKIFKKKIIFDIFDYLYTQKNEKTSIFQKYIVYLQHKIINFADGTIICTEQRKEQIGSAKPKKLEVIHNTPLLNHKHLSKLELNQHKIKIVYVGILQDLRFLIELADVIKEIPECELHIGGFGKYEKYFEQMSYQYNNIIYYGKLPYHKTLELENSCDIMTAIYDPSIGNHYYAAPNKFYESLALGKPIIMVKNTGMSELVVKHNIGEVIDYNKDSLKKAIKKLISRKNEWPTIAIRMQQIYLKNYRWNEMEQRLINFYEEIV